jgi:hypothetical protein
LLKDPFPHAVIDDFYDPAKLDRVLAEWPREGWNRSDRATSVKSVSADTDHFPPAVLDVITDLHSPGFCVALERLTGIDELIPDPSCQGGGLHEIKPGGLLGMHVEFNWGSNIQAVRKVNLLLYLNRGWTPEWKGELLLGLENPKRIAPLFNRCVIFPTTDTSYHGHPEKLTPPAGRSRKSIALYYYRREAPPKNWHSTIYKK